MMITENDLARIDRLMPAARECAAESDIPETMLARHTRTLAYCILDGVDPIVSLVLVKAYREILNK